MPCWSQHKHNLQLIDVSRETLSPFRPVLPDAFPDQAKENYAIRYSRGLDPITPMRSSSAISSSVIPSISAKTCRLCSPEQRRGRIGAKRGLRDARDRARIEMRPDDSAIDRDEIFAALDLRVGHHRRRRIHRRDKHSRVAETRDAIVGVQWRDRARQFRVERVLVGFARGGSPRSVGQRRVARSQARARGFATDHRSRRQARSSCRRPRIGKFHAARARDAGCRAPPALFQ